MTESSATARGILGDVLRVVTIAFVLNTLPLPASAHSDAVRGRVIDVRSPDLVFVHHDALATMPAMTMPYRVDPSTWARLRRGDTVEGAVDMRTEPWRLAIARIVTPKTDEPIPYVPMLGVGDALGNAAFIDQHGRRVTLSQFRGSALILSFVYTRCADVRMCPLVSAKFAQLQRRIVRDRIHLLEVTLDPAHDTPLVLARYGAQFDADSRLWTLATGDAHVLEDLAERVGIVAKPTAHGIVHSEAVVIIDPNGRIDRIIDGNNWTPDQAFSEARAALGAPSNDLARFAVWLAQGVVAACGGGRSGISTGTAIGLFLGFLAVGAVLIRWLFRSVLA